MESLDPHQRPPDGIRNVYKKYQKMKSTQLDGDADIVDPERDILREENTKVRTVREINPQQLRGAFRKFVDVEVDIPDAPIPVYEHADMPGLHILPALLPPPVQSTLLSRLLHRDLSNPTHLTNIHTHYTLSYPPNHSSFFSLPPTHPTPIAHPLDPTIHKPLPITPLLTKKLRWMTLGGQYDWTLKRYPATPPPAFPPDIGDLLEGLFPETRAEAAIVNLYSPGDTLSVHRDVAERCGTGLISISLGCDACSVYEWGEPVRLAWCTADCAGDVPGVFGGVAGWKWRRRGI
ncbi:oxidoreductase domain-containing protein [Westerdykella ornata]|uniref:Oxidoreductase domain-containing protein n=1 Tax=Westerdykella ornata TaxID=318751 RepID=A0A6A6JT54_WESOR|nr:oxidoreductase domain-containing protein [Westerdykella ornata]KAF2279752.1 oxidoreductase domain-containing protein [Westerdykella ornata]